MLTYVRTSLLRLFVMTLVIFECIAGSWRAAAAQSDASGFGTPPPGRIEILFNDRHVYVRPTKLEHGRVLGALARGGTFLVPGRSLFEAMGARVTYDPSTQTLRASKPGAQIEVRAGKHSVAINGEVRPLDVAPEVLGGTLYVPFRVLSEGLGAFVTWVPERKLVAIRYLPPASSASIPAPAPVASPQAPSPTATATPAAAAKPVPPYVRFVAVDLSLAPRTANEFTPHLTGRTTQSIRFALEYRPLVVKIGKISLFGRSRSFVEGEYRRFNYPHDGGPVPYAQGTPCSAPGGLGPMSGNSGCVTPIGGSGSAYANATNLTEEEFALHQSIIGVGHTYIASGLFARRNHYGYPTLRSNFGIGIEALPDLSKKAALYGSAFYYPEVTGFYTPPAGAAYRLRYKLFTYRVGGTLALGKVPFLDAGYIADHYIGKQNAPAAVTHGALQLGIGVHF